MMPGMTAAAAGSPGQPGVTKASKKVCVTSRLVQCTDEQNFSFTHQYSNHESATTSALLKGALPDPSIWSQISCRNVAMLFFRWVTYVYMTHLNKICHFS